MAEEKRDKRIKHGVYRKAKRLAKNQVNHQKRLAKAVKHDARSDLPREARRISEKDHTRKCTYTSYDDSKNSDSSVEAWRQSGFQNATSVNFLKL